jgi:predicted RND superfamily exporter protein
MLKNRGDEKVKKFAKFITHKRILILVIAVLLLIPSVYGMVTTKINYDILTYLPKDLDSMKGQTILDKTFSSAATSFLIVEDMQPKDIVKLKDNISKVDGVEKAIWTSDVLDTSIPKEILPDEVSDILYNKNSTLIIIKYKDSASSEATMNAIEKIKKISGKQCFLSGMSAIVKDTKDLSDKETPFYVLVAVLLSVLVLSLTMESVIIPFIFLLGIGMAILYNMGTNLFLGQISYITKALAAVLQLAVTMDFSIFLLHRYDEERNNFSDKNEAMAEAIVKTLAAIGGSAATAIAGFLAMCVMKLGLGVDIGLVMAKGVFLGVLSTITILPALILVFDKAIYNFRHRSLLPEFSLFVATIDGRVFGSDSSRL